MGMRQCGRLGAGCIQSILPVPEAATTWVINPSEAETVLRGVPTHQGRREFNEASLGCSWSKDDDISEHFRQLETCSVHLKVLK